MLSASALQVGTDHCIRTSQYDHYPEGNWADLTAVGFLVDSRVRVSLAGKEINSFWLSWTLSIYLSAF